MAFARRSRSRRREPDQGRDLGPEADPESVARTIVLTKLTSRARSRQELEQALTERDVPAEVATRVLNRFEEVGLVDEAAFARDWVASRQQSRALSSRALRYELRGKGVADELVDEALDDLGPDADRAAADDVVRRKLRSVRSLPPEVAQRRLMGALARKGFSAGLAAQVVRDALGDDSNG